MSTVLTATGRHIKLDEMTKEDVCIVDVVQGLSQVKRFNGRGVSVLEHTLAMYHYAAKYYGGLHKEEVLRGILLHDMAEAYTGDIIQPVKSTVPEIEELESAVLRAIEQYFAQNEQGYLISTVKRRAVSDVVKRIDKLALAAEYQHVFGKNHTESDPVWGINTLDSEGVCNMAHILGEVIGPWYSSYVAFLDLCKTLQKGQNLVQENATMDGYLPFADMDTSARARQVGGNHYKDLPIQPIDYIVKNGLGYMEGNIIKYVTRYPHKNGVEDLKKARHYLDMLIESLEVRDER